MKNKRGYTLIELLAVIIILGIIMIIGTISVNKIIKNTTVSAKEVSRWQVEKAAEACYVTENNEMNCSNTDYLISKKYIEPFDDEYEIKFNNNGNATVSQIKTN